MRYSADGLALTKAFESFSSRPYRCPAGIWTIGYGHTGRDVTATTATIDEDRAVALLRADVVKAERSVCRLIRVPLTQGQYDALVDFCVNLGGGALQASRLRRCVNDGEHDDVPEELLRWVHAGGRVLAGLVRRRKAEALLYSRAS